MAQLTTETYFKLFCDFFSVKNRFEMGICEIGFHFCDCGNILAETKRKRGKMLGNFIRTILFIAFAGAGVLAMGLAMLAGELQDVYQMRVAVVEIESSNEQISQLISDHEELIANIEHEPNMIERIVPVVIGAKTSDSIEPVAKIATEKIAMAKYVLDESNTEKQQQQCPQWLIRCGEKSRRIIIFIAGAGLVATSFACFCKKNTKK